MVLPASINYALIPTTLCGPAVSMAVPWTIPASSAATGLVRLAVVPTLTTCSLMVPISTRPVATIGTAGGLYAVSLGDFIEFKQILHKVKRKLEVGG